MDFIKESSRDTDIFCFQEVFSSPSSAKISRGTYVNVLSDFSGVLKGYDVFFAPTQDGYDCEGPVDFEVTMGPAIFIKKPIRVLSWESIFICGEKNSAKADDPTTIPANMLCTRIQAGSKSYVVCNVHGFAYPGTKLDTPDRMEQSRKIKSFLEYQEAEKIVCGDFNLMPETESIKMLEENMENLIRKFKISSTRSQISPYFGTSEEQEFADYTFVSDGIKFAV
jgi:exonuclease III